MSLQLDIYKKISGIFNKGEKEGLLFINVSKNDRGQIVHHKNKMEMLDFGTCAYLGMEKEAHIVNEVSKNLKQYGLRISSSQVYARSSLYDAAEKALKEIFDTNIILTTTTTLAHQITIPVLIHSDAVVCYDEYIHNSVKQALKLRYNIPQSKAGFIFHKIVKKLTSSKIRVNFHKDIKLSHNTLDDLDTILRKYPRRKVWYICDGTYSMHGDTAPLDEIKKYLDKYDNLYVYIDDAHGFGITGSKGCGSAFEILGLHQRVLYTFSLAKALSATGGIIVCPNTEWYKYLRYFGENYTFGCAISNAGLLEIKAACHILCSNKGEMLREKLNVNIKLLRKMLAQKNLLISNVNEKYPSPIIHLKISDVDKTKDLVSYLRNQGFYVIPTSYPAVSIEDTGLRISVTSNQREHDYELLCHFIEEFMKLHP